jgi:dextranase
MASPDAFNGIPVDLEFTTSGDKVTFYLPQLKYWDMIVVS